MLIPDKNKTADVKNKHFTNQPAANGSYLNTIIARLANEAPVNTKIAKSLDFIYFIILSLKFPTR